MLYQAHNKSRYFELTKLPALIIPTINTLPAIFTATARILLVFHRKKAEICELVGQNQYQKINCSILSAILRWDSRDHKPLSQVARKIV